MKELNFHFKVIILISAFLISSSSTYSQWSIVGTLDGIDGPIPQVSVVDENTAFVTGGYNENGNATYKTTNGGLNWIRLNTGTCSPFYALWSNDGNTVFAGDNGGVNVGGSGGITYFFENINERSIERSIWTVIDSIPQVTSFCGFRGMRFSKSIPSFGIAYALGDSVDVYIYKTRDGGNTWTKSLLQGFPGYYASGGLVVIDSLFYAFCTHIGPPSIIITTDGGRRWDLRSTNLPNDGQNKGRGLAFKEDKLTGIAGSSSTNDIARTTDGGLTWVTIDVGNNITQGLGPVMRWIEGTDICYMTAKASSDPDMVNKGVLKSTNGGLNWTAMETEGVGMINIDTKKIGSNIFGYGISYGSPYGGNLVLKFTDVITGINQISESVPEGYFLSQNYPNPFNPVTNLEFGISHFGFVSLIIYDMIGKEVTSLVKSKLNPGTYKYNFEASSLPSGVYFYKLAVDGNVIDTKRMVLLK